MLLIPMMIVILSLVVASHGDGNHGVAMMMMMMMIMMMTMMALFDSKKAACNETDLNWRRNGAAIIMVAVSIIVIRNSYWSIAWIHCFVCQIHCRIASEYIIFTLLNYPLFLFCKHFSSDGIQTIKKVGQVFTSRMKIYFDAITTCYSALTMIKGRMPCHSVLTVDLSLLATSSTTSRLASY